MNRDSDNEQVGIGDVWRHASRFFTRLPLALLGTWAAMTIVLIALLVWQNRVPVSALTPLPVDVVATSTTEFLLVLIATEVVAMLRLGLLLPARLAYRGADLSWRAMLRMCADRFLPVLDLNLKLGFAFTIISLICVTLDVSMTLWVILPFAFLLRPAEYLVTAHQMSANRAITTSLRIARRHWMPIFLVFGSLTCLFAGLPSLVDAFSSMGVAGSSAANVAEQVGRGSIYLAAEFILFLASCGLYFALDEVLD